MTHRTLTSAAAELLDREAIRDCVYRSALANDICDKQMWKSVYWPEGNEDHGYYKGNAHAFVDMVTPMISTSMDATWHQIANVIIRLNAPSAKVHSYALVYCRMIGAKANRWDLLAGVRYLDQFEKRAGEWRIFDRVTKTDWMREASDSLDWSRIDPNSGKPMPLGMRGPGDPLFALFAHGDLSPLRNGLDASVGGQ